MRLYEQESLNSELRLSIYEFWELFNAWYRLIQVNNFNLSFVAKHGY
jgi:hypothetical protein